MRHDARRRRGHGPAWILFSFLVLLLLISALRVHAAPAESDWHLYTADAVVDTLDGGIPAIFQAGAWVLLHDNWEIEKKDADKGCLITGWKPVKHPLVKLTVGQSRVRVAVGLRALTPGRTEVTVRGGIASREPLGAVEGLARKAGTHECENYVVELKARLAEDRLTDGAPSASPRGTAEKR
jgi:hypothetical protein